ncbi:hypothetical protein [Phenylobacterium sp.]|uniref:hypothetical protein n=1 Tax=Phenylobacterium sp. TaxID=1871053 RepID=UPI00286E6360|nr:hypothetical protein [Phenylobacterium sp.]
MFESDRVETLGSVILTSILYEDANERGEPWPSSAAEQAAFATRILGALEIVRQLAALHPLAGNDQRLVAGLIQRAKALTQGNS